MVLTPSTMLALGTAAPDFCLPNVMNGQEVTLESFSDKSLLLVIFISKHCPYVQHIKGELTRLGKDYANKSVGILAISANDIVKYPDDSPEELKQLAYEEGWGYPVCYDESQETAKAYTAACTPDFFLFDSKRQLIYRGQLDDSRPDSGKPLTGKDLRAAIDAGLRGDSLEIEQRPSMGCNVKWKVGNEPAYFKN